MQMKTTLHDLKRKTTVSSHDIAQQANLSIGDVFAVEIGGYTSREKARKVVHAFNLLSGMQVELDDIRIHCEVPLVLDEHQEQKR